MRRLFLVALFVVDMVGGAGATAQQAPRTPARDTSARGTGSAVIRGRVVTADSGTPIRRAVVRLAPVEIGEPRSKLTDVDGRYEFRDLPAGNYSVAASKNGFVPGSAGAVRPNAAPKLVALEEGRVVSADVALARAGVIAGRVLDDFGDPVPDAQVVVLRSLSVGGVRRVMRAGGGTTNDLGQFRVHGLAPGSYFVAALVAAPRDAESDDRAGYAPTYHPGSANASQAQPVQVSAGQEAGGIAIRLTVARVARISGVAFDSRGQPPVNSFVTARPVDSALASAVSGTSASVLQNGSFVINGVPPGDYLLELRAAPASSRPGARQEYGSTRVSVAGSDVDGVTIQSSSGATISGQVLFEGAAPPLKTPVTVAATVAPSAEFGTSPSAPPPERVAPDGRFLLTGVFGATTFRVNGQPAGWALKAVYVDGRDVVDTPVVLEGTEQIAGVQIVLTDRLPRVTASVTDERGQPVDGFYLLVLPDDPARFQPGSRFVRTFSASGGGVKIDGLPPGGYIALALKSALADFDISEREVFDFARRVGTRFSLLDGDQRSLTLRVIEESPARQ